MPTSSKDIDGYQVIDREYGREVWMNSEHVVDLSPGAPDECVSAWLRGFEYGRQQGIALGKEQIRGQARQVFGFPRN